MLGMLGKLLNTLTCVFACECKSHFVGKVEIRFMIQTIYVVTFMVLLGKPLQYVLFWCRSLGFPNRSAKMIGV